MADKRDRVCVGEATGAGGANVWGSDDLRAALDAAEEPLPRLPKGVHFTVALRRAVRSGDADGTLIEDAGIAGQRYDMTRDDALDNNRDLIELCAELLAAQPLTRLDVTRIRRTLSIDTQGLQQLDVYLNGHPAGSPIVLQGDGKQRFKLAPTVRDIEVVGFADGVVRQRRHLKLQRR